ncbi:MAG: DUF58 domain-containing protein [Proteobacteria bacterium]|nr:DUF58 domain-containing protein [Pseudomonadota bacterium]
MRASGGMQEASPQALFDEEFLKKIEYLYVMSKKVFTGRLRADRKTRKVAAGIEFADYRNYAPGDDFRALDWRVFGRTEKLLVRLFEEKEDLQIAFLIDVSASMRYGTGAKLRYAQRMAAALAYIGLCNMDRVSLFAYSDKIVGRLLPLSGRGQIFKVFHFLEGLESGGGTSFEEAFRRFSDSSRRRGLAVVLSDFYNPGGFENALNFLHYQQFETYAVHIEDPAERNISARGDVSLVDAETGEALTLTMTPGILTQYARAYDAQCRQIESYCVKRHMLYFRTPVDLPFDEIVLKIFRAGGFLK